MVVVGLHFDQEVVGVVVPNFAAQQEGYQEVEVHDPDQGQGEGDDQTSREGVHVGEDLAFQMVEQVQSYQVKVYSMVDDYPEKGGLCLG